MKVFRCSSPCVQIMNLHQMNGLNKELSMSCCSNLPMNKLVYEGPMRVPIAVMCLQVIFAIEEKGVSSRTGTGFSLPPPPPSFQDDCQQKFDKM